MGTCEAEVLQSRDCGAFQGGCNSYAIQTNGVGVELFVLDVEGHGNGYTFLRDLHVTSLVF